LPAGARWAGLSRREERCLVLLRGSFDIIWDGTVRRLGPRADVFEGYPHAVYLPAGTKFDVHAVQACEIADCRAPSLPSRALAPRAIAPEDCGFEIRGGGNATRQIVDIMPPAFPADRLLVCEVYTPGGNWSSYPPHKHDTDDPPREVDLEEIYYFRYGDPDAYGFQRVYKGRRDDTLRVVHGDVVAVRDGYHPFVTAYGHDAYYLNVLAGTRRSMAASDDPRYARFRGDWPPPDPRLPMVTPPSIGKRAQ
jgi:5-deoxy-glucuronate isomerase